MFETDLKLFVKNIFGGVIIFTIFYYCTNYVSGTHFHSIGKSKHNPKISLFDAFYYSMVTQTTVGYGDVIAYSILAKSLTLLQLVTLLLMTAKIII